MARIDLNETAVYNAALALVKFAKAQGKPVAVSIEEYAHYIVGNVQRDRPPELEAWLKSDEDSRPLTPELAEELAASYKHQKASGEVVKAFVEMFQDCLTGNELQEIGDFAFVEYGAMSKEYEGKLYGTVYLLMPFPKAADCAVLDF